MAHAIIITGMHRSGTSLTSSLLQHSGVHIGEKLLPANSANPRGFFEDVDFYEYHEQLLHERGQAYLQVDADFTFQPTDAEIERAHQLIAERSHRSFWGWKDPRTSLFLDFWHQLIPDARFLFLYRHPIEVMLSLLRRGDFDSSLSLNAGLHAWYKYNASIEAFFDRHSDRCLLIHIDGVVKQTARFAELLQEKLQLDSCLDSEALARVYHANELQKTSFPPELPAILTRIDPQSLELYERLNKKAALCGDELQTDSASSAPMSQLAQFAEGFAEPISAPAKHSLIQLLLSSLAPEFTERMFDRYYHQVNQAQQKAESLWREVQWRDRVNAEQNLEVDRLRGLSSEQSQELDHLRQLSGDQSRELNDLQQLSAEQSQTLNDLQRLNAVQNQALDNLQWLNMEQIQELERQVIQIESLAAELDSIRGTRIWKAVQSYRKLKDRWKNAA